MTDADRFRQTMTTGIGASRAYGCGLLSVARCAVEHAG
ncbi:type I-E CRISPR-associated protein Cas6/Cse3/CasE [Symbiobacterium thermophilum]